MMLVAWVLWTTTTLTWLHVPAGLTVPLSNSHPYVLDRRYPSEEACHQAAVGMAEVFARLRPKTEGFTISHDRWWCEPAEMDA